MRASFFARFEESPNSVQSHMSIQNELCSDIAVALLTGKDRDPKRLDDLKQVVLKVHSILQEASRNVSSERVRAASVIGDEKTDRRRQ